MSDKEAVTDAKLAAKDTAEEESSDVEMEGMDLEDDDDDDDAAAEEGDDDNNDDNDDATGNAESVPKSPSKAPALDEEKLHQLEEEEAKEMEAARTERMELMQAAQNQAPTDAASKLEYLLGQSEVFAHFMAGSVAATDKRKKKAGAGKSSRGRMSEAEEDAQLLKSAASKRRLVRLEKQPSILADHCKMHKYQIEGLNFLVHLHDHGIHGILADEMGLYVRKCVVCRYHTKMIPVLMLLVFSLQGKNTSNYFAARLLVGNSWYEGATFGRCTQVCCR